MKEHIKNFLNEEQDPKAVEKITSKLNDILMRNGNWIYWRSEKTGNQCFS